MNKRFTIKDYYLLSAKEKVELQKEILEKHKKYAGFSPSLAIKKTYFDCNLSLELCTAIIRKYLDL